jgi:ABC-type transport system involved in cytochrome c biogenesis permease subunit
MGRDVAWRRMPALRSVWFVPHVMSYVLAYALAAVAFALTLVAFVRRTALGRTDDARHEEATHRVLLLAFPFMTFGLLLGAVWADAAWGDYWGWDPKETWALIMWTLYVMYFHCRMSPRFRRYAGAVQVIAFLTLIVTFLFVNLLPRFSATLHSYS